MAASHEVEYLTDQSRARAEITLKEIKTGYSPSTMIGGGVLALAHVALYAVDVWRAKP